MNKALTQNLQTHPWFRLNPRWQSRADRIRTIDPANQLSTAFSMVLLSDGSTTQNLRLLTGEPVHIDLISMTPQRRGLDGAPRFLSAIPAPRLRRQVWLRTQSGRRLAYAVSWWPEGRSDEFLEKRNIPIWSSLSARRIELYREIKTVLLGDCEELERAFSTPGPFWGRYYFFWHGGQPLTLIHEVFHPMLDGEIS
ncbi:MAG: chorismate lyase [Gammaproteobacteria bacterium]